MQTKNWSSVVGKQVAKAGELVMLKDAAKYSLISI